MPDDVTPESRDQETDAQLRAWGEQQRRAAAERAPRLTVHPEPARRRWPAITAAAGTAAAVALVGGLLASRGSHRTSPIAGPTTGPGTPTTTSTPAPGTQQVTYRRLAVRVPATWTINNARCGSPQGDTVLLPGAVLGCLTPIAPGVSWVDFGPTGSSATALRHAVTRHLTVDGHAAIEVVGRLHGDAAVRVTVPDAAAAATVYSPHIALARKVAATLAVVDHDSHGCASQLTLRPLTAASPASVAGASDTLVPGRPQSMAVCRYDGSWLTGGGEVPAAELPGDVALLRDLPAGLSIAAARFNTAYSCTAPGDPATSLDRHDREWFTVLVRYRGGRQLELRARLGLCGYLGVTNGSRTGQETMALVNFLFDTTRISGGYPPHVDPAH